ncbi:uncharacterized protein LOC114325503 isoform X3 [Diabrotica virgifera virgifera]|uniref:Uncharacterized protein LOC114325503 isoform X3 n=1 Tax=Diabrotica virgifera virgifera TaxID=50390 RepID=A0A6P7F195_DIAVI|nr:uncharacterized protein LOC114325503 isoform X3 [Diabrotica virgifera virgifera]
MCFFVCFIIGLNVRKFRLCSSDHPSTAKSPFFLEMSNWAARMHRRAATFGNVVTSCGHPTGHFPRRLEKVKFGVSLEEVCKNDIPGPLLVLILKLNKEAPYRKDVFRAPGNQGAMKKLIHFLQTGRLVNMDNFSVYTIASVLKKFLRKVPGGVFGKDIENKIFQIIDVMDFQVQQEEIHKIIISLPVYTQRLLVLLFGTFRVIASNSEKAATGMTSEALGVSVAPSFFHSCVSDGKTARMEDVTKYKVASRVMKHLIEEFASSNLFGRENYEYYARVTGRVLRIQGEWICSFQYPPPPTNGSFPNEYTALERYLLAMSQMDECQSTPTLLESGLQPQVSLTSLGIIVGHELLESCTRLSVSLEQNGLFQVHERQTERMKTRSQWFLGPSGDCASCRNSLDFPLNEMDVSALTNAFLRKSSSGTIGKRYDNLIGIAGLSISAESVQKRPSVKRANSRDKRLLHRTTSRRNKENNPRPNN